MRAHTLVLAPALSVLAVLAISTAALADGRVALTPAGGSAGSRITLKGGGFPAAGRVRIAVTGSRRTLARLSPAGRFSKTLTLPRGRHSWLKIVSTSRHRVVVNTFHVSRTHHREPVMEVSSSAGGRIRISPTTPKPGGLLEVRGVGFAAGKRLRLTWPGTDRKITARHGGRFAVNTPLPGMLGSGVLVGRVVGRGIHLTFRLDAAPTAPPTAPPVNTFAPGINGAAVKGQTLTADPGGWSSGGAITYGYQWQRCKSASCSDIPGATAPRYVLVAADVGYTMRIKVSARNSAGQAVALSGPTLPVQAQGTPSPAGAVAVWHMDALGTMTDSAGTNNGTLYGVGLDPAGYLGAAYSFNGSSWVSVPNAAALNPGSANVKISLAIKTTAAPPPTVQDWDLARKGLYTSGSEFKIEYYPSAQVGCAFNGSQGMSGEHPAGPRLNDGKWHTIECRKTATAISTVVDGTTVYSAAVAVGSISNSADVAIGARPGSEYFQGSIDEIVIAYG